MVYFIHSPSVLRDKILAWIAKTEKNPKITILKTSEGLRFAYGKVRPVFPYCRIYLKMTLMDWFKQIQLNYLSHIPYSLRQNFRRFSLRCFFLHFGLHSEKPKILFKKYAEFHTKVLKQSKYEHFLYSMHIHSTLDMLFSVKCAIL